MEYKELYKIAINIIEKMTPEELKQFIEEYSELNLKRGYELKEAKE